MILFLPSGDIDVYALAHKEYCSVSDNSPLVDASGFFLVSGFSFFQITV